MRLLAAGWFLVVLLACGEAAPAPTAAAPAASPSGSTSDGLVVSGGYSGFIPKDPPSACVVWTNLDARHPGLTLIFQQAGAPVSSSGLVPNFNFLVYPYKGPAQYALTTDPLGVWASLTFVGSDDAFQRGWGTIGVKEMSSTAASGTVDLTLSPAGFRPETPAARIQGTWACQVTAQRGYG
jgi:hypothetical protein